MPVHSIAYGSLAEAFGGFNSISVATRLLAWWLQTERMSVEVLAMTL